MTTTDLIRRLQGRELEIDALTPRDFELVVAELLAGFGWQVSVTSPTRDGGVDVFAVSTDASKLEVTWIVECKRYASENPVSVSALRQLFGVKEYLGASNGLLVTTSHFTRDANLFAEKRRDLHRVDRTRLQEWIDGYQRRPIQQSYTSQQSFQSCFLSHSTADSEFAATLHAALRELGIRVWFAPNDMRPGDKIFSQIRKAIASSDRLLIVLSDASMNSSWVQTELREAILRERRENRRVLFPISLLKFERLRDWEVFDSDSGTDLARVIREYFILDFSSWEDRAQFNLQVARLAEALRAAA